MLARGASGKHHPVQLLLPYVDSHELLVFLGTEKPSALDMRHVAERLGICHNIVKVQVVFDVGAAFAHKYADSHCHCSLP
jgi:hypothetical protein